MTLMGNSGLIRKAVRSFYAGSNGRIIRFLILASGDYCSYWTLVATDRTNQSNQLERETK